LVLRPHIYYQLDGDEKPTVDNVLKAWFYLFQQLCKVEEFQMRGVVFITYMVDVPEKALGLPIAKELGAHRDTMATRVAALHFCYNNKKLRPWIAAHKLYYLSQRNRARLRHHFVAHHQEAVFRLQTFGIPINNSHLRHGYVSDAMHKEWLKQRTSFNEVSPCQEQDDYEPLPVDIEFISAMKDLLEEEEKGEEQEQEHEHEQEQKEEVAEEEEDRRDNSPGNHDVLFGKGKKIKHHVGNQKMEKIIESYQIEYENAGKFAKTDISERIISAIHDRGGRFLKYVKSDDKWVEVDRIAAREKISHYFRHLRRQVAAPKLKSSNNKSQSKSKRSPPPTKEILLPFFHVQENDIFGFQFKKSRV
jgi:hypothetical protein